MTAQQQQSSMEKQLMIPYNFKPRDYQIPLLEAMDSGYTRAVVVWHRRAGKDKTLINLVVKKAVQRVGTYYYFFPTYRQGKKILWNGIDRDGFKFMDHIPKQIIKRKDNTEMLVELLNGSIIQIIGTDKVDSIVGTNPIGCVFSEYALQDPIAWGYIRPILAENGGWAVFNFTPRGENHGYDLYEYALHNENWFTQLLTVDDTGAIPKDVLDRERAEIIAEHGNEALFLQEYYCSFEAPIPGAYYATQLMELSDGGRITEVPYQPELPVITAWDLGVDDSTAIWFIQLVGQEIHVIDFLEEHGKGFDWYAKQLQERPYYYSLHYLPHDVRGRELSTGKTRLEALQALMPSQSLVVVPKLRIDDGIHAVRSILSRCWFDKKKTRDGMNALRSYHQRFDEKRKAYDNSPEHDWSSHAADAFRYFAVGFDQELVVRASDTTADSYDVRQEYSVPSPTVSLDPYD